MSVLNGVMNGQIADNTNGATYYLAPNLVKGELPTWAQGQPTATIGAHVFFNPSNSGGLFQPVTQDDVAGAAQAAGISGGSSGFVPVSSGGGITISLPAGATSSPSPPSSIFNPVTTDDVSAAMRSAGLTETSAAKAKHASDLPAGITPEIEAAAQKVAPNMGASGFAEGMPIIGQLPGMAASAAGAALPWLKGAGGLPHDLNATFAERYQQNQAVQKEASRLWAEQHPLQAAFENVAGAGMALGPVAQTNIGAAALGLPNTTPLGATLGGRVYTGIAGGALINALDAALRGENPVTGAEVGGAFGAAGPLIGEAAGKAVQGLTKALALAPGALADINTVGRGWLADALANETPASIAAAQQRMGPTGFLADINPAMTEIAAGIANKPQPPASSVISEAYRERAVGKRGVIEGALDRSFGPSVNVEQLKSMITENRAAAADPLYKQWRNMEVQPTPELEALIPRLQAAGAFDEANFLGAVKGKNIRQAFFTPGGESIFVAKPPTGELTQMQLPKVTTFPTTETWDLVKRGLDSKIEQALSAGNKTRVGALLSLKNDLIGEIGKTEAGQVWNQARREFADRSELIDSIEAGRDTFLGSRSGLTVDQLRQELTGLSGPELAARIVGARAAADEVMGATIRGDTTLRNKFLAPNNQAKLRLLIGDDRAQQLVDTLEQQQYLSGQAQYVNPRAGSPTAPRSAAIGALEAPQLREWSPKITEPLSLIPPSWIEALRPSTILQGQPHIQICGGATANHFRASHARKSAPDDPFCDQK